MSDRIGNWMQTIGGRAFYPLDPHPSDIDIMDIGCALSMLCRFGGHCNRFYSVAEHSFRVSKAIEEAGGTKDEMFAGLMHDAAEAYVGDMVWPVKQAMPEYKRIEKLVEQAIAMKFDLPDPMPPIGCPPPRTPPRMSPRPPVPAHPLATSNAAPIANCLVFMCVAPAERVLPQ